ncbi:MAG: biotin--[acetyl-CoA-carboxylase] ligase [Planctomycetota bacterium]|jgi:biotin-[acetyl-CoA-carboxylase] ligase BirA-like protein
MIAIALNLDFAARVLPPGPREWLRHDRSLRPELQPLIGQIFGEVPLRETEVKSPPLWEHLFLVESSPRSQFDLLVELGREGRLPPRGLVCVAGEGRGFHGMRNRPWVAPAGNLYLSAHLAPDRPVGHAGVAFTVLAAVSVLDAVDGVSGLTERAGIKWVNDILIEGAKVCGVIAHSQMEGNRVGSVFLGIGLNVETAPEVEPTPQVPQAACLAGFVPCHRCELLGPLLETLARNYEELLEEGYGELLNRYRRRSLALGREVAVSSEEGGITARGRVTAIGPNLELHLKGRDRPVHRGRLILEDPLESTRYGID